MTKKRTQLGRRKPNPMSAKSAKPPRNRLSFDGSTLTATIFVPASTTVANIASDFQQLGCDANVGVTRGMNNMIRQYREYKFRKVTFQWIPNVGPASGDAGSRVYFMYTENPEQGSAFQTGAAPLDTIAKRVNFVKGSRNVFAFNAWERVTWNVPLVMRRKWYDVNTSDPTSDVNAYDRAVQGLVGQAYESFNAAVVLGTVKITYVVDLRGLDVDAGAIV